MGSSQLLDYHRQIIGFSGSSDIISLYPMSLVITRKIRKRQTKQQNLSNRIEANLKKKKKIGMIISN